MNAIMQFLPLFRRIRWPLLVTLLLSLVTLGAGIALLGVSGWFLTAAALSTAGASFNLFGPSAGVRGLSFLRIVSRYGEKLSGHDATLRLLSDLRRWLFARLFPLVPLARRFGRGDLVSRLLGDVEALDTMFLVALGPISTAALTGVLMTGLLTFTLPAAAPIYAASFAVAALPVTFGLVMLSRADATAAAQAASALRGAVLDGVEGHRDLVLFGATDTAVARVDQAAQRLAAWRRRLGGNGAIAGALVQAMMAVALIGTLYTGIAALRANEIEGPLLVGLLLAVIASFEASAVLVRSASRLAGAAAAAGRLAEISATRADEPATATPALRLDAEGSVAFEGVRFGYGPEAVLEDATFHLAGGACAAIGGASGAGKSTIAQLLVGLLAPAAGTIRIAGADIARVSRDDLRRHVALMTQDAPVFHDSIRANLTIGAPDASDDELWAMLEAVRLAEFVRALPAGLGSYVGEAGRTLSTGQARRLCLARTLLAPARVIVLDEPTSGLDQPTEASFLEQLPELLAGRTGIVITHAEPPASFERVLKLRAGRLEEVR